jgi:hypothetical protein
MEYETTENRSYEGDYNDPMSRHGHILTRWYEDESRGYDRDRSRSPREGRNGDAEGRDRSASPNGRNGNTDRYVR